MDAVYFPSQRVVDGKPESNAIEAKLSPNIYVIISATTNSLIS
jgi:hypothetical protein